jgi:hypothetical protein
MLLLFESAAGYALFKVLKEGKLKDAEVPSQLHPAGRRCMHMHGAEMRGVFSRAGPMGGL